MPYTLAYSQEIPVVHIPIGEASTPTEAPVRLKLVKRFQQYHSGNVNRDDLYDPHIYSPKSAIFLSDASKLYINSLEGYETVVYDAKNWQRIKVISHRFSEKDSVLFDGQHTLFSYKYAQKRNNYNVFSGKPVESCFSHHDRYLWVPYYRRSFDKHAVSPSALAIINTATDSIERVMPTGPLPKMVAASPDGKYLAVTHWGDNTIAIIDIASADPHQFKYIKHFVVGRQLYYSFTDEQKVDRDNECGLCLRGTAFSPDSKYLLVGRMGGGGLAIFDMDRLLPLGTVFGMKENLRHIIIAGEDIYLSSNRTGYVQKAKLKDVIANKLTMPGNNTQFNDWQNCYSGGTGARTIVADSSAKYIFVAVNNDSKLTVIKASDMKKIAEIACDSFPVGMAISPDNRFLAVTSQGKHNQGGNSVMIFNVQYDEDN